MTKNTTHVNDLEDANTLSMADKLREVSAQLNESNAGLKLFLSLCANRIVELKIETYDYAKLIIDLEAEVERLRGALKVYADKGNWTAGRLMISSNPPKRQFKWVGYFTGETRPSDIAEQSLQQSMENKTNDQ